MVDQRTVSKVLTFVTSNKGKLKEGMELMGGHINLVNVGLDVPEMQGDPISIAKEKCRQAFLLLGSAVITDDTSLCFEALKGLPGPYIKEFSTNLGIEGLIKLLAGFPNKRAYAMSILAFCDSADEDVQIFVGKCHGTITDAPRGNLSFGWDPVFAPDYDNYTSMGIEVGFSPDDLKTYAELDASVKNQISHRGRAFAALSDFIVKNKPEFVKD